MRHLISLFDLSTDELLTLLRAADELKRRLAKGEKLHLLNGKVIGLLFEKPSLRTRVSFESGVARLGGSSLFLGNDVGWGNREAPSDFTRVLGRYIDLVVCRAKQHSKVQELARYNAMHVINGLTDLCHPCQALADLQTIREKFGSLKDKHLLFVGDGNNVANSLALGCAMTGMQFTLACPAGYELNPEWLQQIRERYPHAKINQTPSANDAVKHADVIYTDVWTSMGQEAEQAKRRRDFAKYQVNGALLAKAPKHAIVLHCLPAVRGEEITDEAIDSEQSRIIDQAENRMHAQNALMVWLMEREWIDREVG